MSTASPIEVRHFITEGGIRKMTNLLAEFAEQLGIIVPLDMNIERCGIGGVVDKTFVHGPHRLATVQLGMTTGRHDATQVLEIHGAEILAAYPEAIAHAVSFVLLMVTSEDWFVRWATTKTIPWRDRGRLVYGVADATGQHILNLERRDASDPIWNQAWKGAEVQPMDVESLMRLFDRRFKTNKPLRRLPLVELKSSRFAA